MCPMRRRTFSTSSFHSTLASRLSPSSTPDRPLERGGSVLPRRSRAPSSVRVRAPSQIHPFLTLKPDSRVKRLRGYRRRLCDGVVTVGRVSQKARALAAARLIWRVATLPPLRLFILLLAIGSVGASLAGCGSGGNGEKLGERVMPLGQPVPKGGGRYRDRRRLQGGRRLVSAARGRGLRPGRHGVLVWRAVSWPPHRQWRDLRHGKAVGGVDRPCPCLSMRASPISRTAGRSSFASTIAVLTGRAASWMCRAARRSCSASGNKGTARVRVQYLARAPLNGDDSYERRYLASQSWAQVASRGGARDHDAVGSIAAGVKRPAKRTYQAEPSRHRRRNRTRPSPRRKFAGRRAPVPPAFRLRAPGQADTSFRQARSEARTMPREPGRCSAASPRSRSLRRRPVATTLFRVRVGPFADQETAASALAEGDRGWLSRCQNRYKLEAVLLAGCFFGSSAR